MPRNFGHPLELLALPMAALQEYFDAAQDEAEKSFYRDLMKQKGKDDAKIAAIRQMEKRAENALRPVFSKTNVLRGDQFERVGGNGYDLAGNPWLTGHPFATTHYSVVPVCRDTTRFYIDAVRASFTTKKPLPQFGLRSSNFTATRGIRQGIQVSLSGVRTIIAMSKAIQGKKWSKGPPTFNKALGETARVALSGILMNALEDNSDSTGKSFPVYTSSYKNWKKRIIEGKGGTYVPSKRWNLSFHSEGGKATPGITLRSIRVTRQGATNFKIQYYNRAGWWTQVDWRKKKGGARARRNVGKTAWGFRTVGQIFQWLTSQGYTMISFPAIANAYAANMALWGLEANILGAMTSIKSGIVDECTTIDNYTSDVANASRGVDPAKMDTAAFKSFQKQSIKKSKRIPDPREVGVKVSIPSGYRKTDFTAKDLQEVYEWEKKNPGMLDPSQVRSGE